MAQVEAVECCIVAHDVALLRKPGMAQVVDQLQQQLNPGLGLLRQNLGRQPLYILFLDHHGLALWLAGLHSLWPFGRYALFVDSCNACEHCTDTYIGIAATCTGMYMHCHWLMMDCNPHFGHLHCFACNHRYCLLLKMARLAPKDRPLQAAVVEAWPVGW